MVGGRSRVLCTTYVHSQFSFLSHFFLEWLRWASRTSRVVCDPKGPLIEKSEGGPLECLYFDLRLLRTAVYFYFYINCIVFQIKIFYSNNAFTAPTVHGKSHFYFNTEYTLNVIFYNIMSL